MNGIAGETHPRAYQRAKQTCDSAVVTTSDVRFELVNEGGVPRSFALFQGPLLLSSVDLAQVIQACAGLGVCAGMNVVGDRDGSQQPNDGDHYHDFNQRKPRLPRCRVFHN